MKPRGETRTALVVGTSARNVSTKEEVTITVPFCNHCKKRYQTCWDLHPQLKLTPKRKNEGLGFEPISADLGVFVKGHTYVTVYVDDLLIVGPDKEEIKQLKQKLKSNFEMTDLGPCAFYLGMSVRRDRRQRTIYLSQRGYIEKMLKDLGMWESNPTTIPIQTAKIPPPDDDYLLDQLEDTPFKALAAFQQMEPWLQLWHERMGHLGKGSLQQHLSLPSSKDELPGSEAYFRRCDF